MNALWVVLIALGAAGAMAGIAGRFDAAMLLVAIPMLALLAIIGAKQFYLWRYDRHALDPRQVLSRRGWLAPRTQIANRVKLHSVSIRQGPLGRWRGYCDLVFGLAGGHLAFRGLRVEDAAKLRTAVLDSIAEVDFAKLAR